MPRSRLNGPAALLLPALLLLTGCGDEPTRDQQPVAAEIRLLSGGDNFSGNLGNGETGDGSTVPVPVVGGHLFSALTAPSFKEVHGLSLDGGLFRWGSPGGDVPQSTPTLVAQLGFIQIDSGDFPFDSGLGACGITDLNAVYCVRDDGVVRGVPEVGSPAPSP